MFLVRTTQISAFEQVARADFESEVAVHCSELAPDRCRALGEARLRRAIHQTVDAAAAHGFTQRGPVRLYIELAIVFGAGFAGDPQYPWAGEQLAREELLDELVRADALYERANAYLEHVGGPDSVAARAAWLRLATAGDIEEDVESTAPELGPARLRALAIEARGAMERAYPEKCAFIGPEPLERLAAHAVESAWTTHGFRTARPLVLMAFLKFAFGHRCEEDPFHPWIGEVFAAGERPDGEPLATTLEREAARWLRAASTPHVGTEEA